MRRAASWSLATAALVAIGVGGVGLARWPVAPEGALSAMNAALGDGEGLRWRAPAAASLTLLPWPHLNIAGARLDDSFGLAVATAREARFGLDESALAAGRLAARDARLVGADLSVDLDRLPIPQAGSDSSSGDKRFARITLADSNVRLVSARQDFDALLDTVDGQIEGLAGGQPLSLSATARWRGERFALSANLADPAAAARGAAEPFSFRLASGPVVLSADGRLWGGGEPGGDGHIDLQIKSLSAAARLLGVNRSRFLLADDLAISATAKASRTGIDLGDVKLRSADQEAEGALAATLSGGRPKISGSLAFERLALAPLFGSMGRWRDANDGWARAPFRFGPPRLVDLDLRLSASELDAFGQKLTNAAGSAIADRGELALTLAEAAYAEGRLSGSADVSRTGQSLTLKADLDLTGVDLGEWLGGFGWPGNSGRADVAVSFEAAGASPAEAVASLAGRASLGAGDGAVAGVDLEEALRRSQRHADDPLRDLRAGVVSFNRVDASLIVAKGVASIASARLQGSALEASARGDVDVASQAWRVRLDAQQTDADGQPSTDASRLLIDVAGPWRAPQATVEQSPPD